jgi:hypothetical protein
MSANVCESCSSPTLRSLRIKQFTHPTLLQSRPDKRSVSPYSPQHLPIELTNFNKLIAALIQGYGDLIA